MSDINEAKQGNRCSICGQVHARSSGEDCSAALLMLGLSESGSRASASSLGASRPGERFLSEHNRFLQQGVLPQFGDYELESEIARGGMGIVFRARQKSLNRTVAIKMILAGQLATRESVQRFRLEAEAAAQLHHPGIVPIYEIGEIETQHFFSMKLIDGSSLGECIQDFQLDPQASPAEQRDQEQCIAELMSRVARALDFAHQRGVLHRDLKPSNILIDEEGLPHLTDFGLAKLTGREASGLTLSSAVLGTPGYLAPEQASGRLDQVTTAADIYGLGATLYELLTGRPPFVGSTALETMWMAIEHSVVPPRQINPAVHRDLETIALRCLEKSPEQRYATAGEVADELERYLRNEPIRARQITLWERASRWRKRNPWLASLAAALVMAILIGSGAALWQWARAEQANVQLRENVAHLEWGAIDNMVTVGQSSRALAKVASLLRADPDDWKAAMFAMSILEQRRFPVPVAPPIRHPSGDELNVARLSPNGSRIVTASYDGTARLWDPATSQELTPPLEHQAVVTWAEFHPDGSVLATSAEDGKVALWDATSGNAIGELYAHPESVTEVRFSPDGRFRLLISRRTIAVLEGKTNRVLRQPIQHAGRIVAARFVLQGDAFFTAEQEGTRSHVRVWDIDSGEVIAAYQGNAIRHADVSDDVSRMVTVENRGVGWLADFPSGASRLELKLENGFLTKARFDASGERVAAMDDGNQIVRVWDAKSALPVTGDLKHYYLLGGLDFVDDGQRLLTWADDSLAQLWDIETGQSYCEPMRHAHRVLHAEAGQMAGEEVFLTTVSHLKSRSSDTKTGAAQLWRVPAMVEDASLLLGIDPGIHDGGVISPDGRLIALGTTSHEVRVIKMETGELVCAPLRTNGNPWGMLYTPDAQRLVTTTSRGQVAVWSIPDGKLVAEPVQLSTAIQPTDMTSDGARFATGSTDGFVRVWETQTGRVIHEMRHGSEINSVGFSPDGRFLVSGGEDRVARIWDVQTGQPHVVLTGHQNEIMAVCYRPDGRQVATASLDFSARLWDSRTGELQFMLPHQGEVLDVEFSPDGRRVATASRDRTVMIWETTTGLPFSRGMLHEQSVRDVAFSPDGAMMLSYYFRGLRLWDVATGHPLTVHLPHLGHGGTGFHSHSSPAFSPDGKAALIASDTLEARLWRFSIPSARVPAWFPEFLESIAGQRFTSGAERPEFVAPERFLAFDRQLRSSTARDEYTRWARRWLTAGSSSRPH